MQTVSLVVVLVLAATVAVVSSQQKYAIFDRLPNSSLNDTSVDEIAERTASAAMYYQ